MNDLTNTILFKNSRYEVVDTPRQGGATLFNNGMEQRIAKYSIPFLSVRISYNGLTSAEFVTLRTAYEQNHARTFICDLGSFIDKREIMMHYDTQTWAFSDFTFEQSANLKVNGTITIVTSVFFYFVEYQTLHTEGNLYSVEPSVDLTFRDTLDVAQPSFVRYSYETNALASSIGRSIRHQRDKQGLRRKYSLKWLLTESKFLVLLQYFRKSGGLMGAFGCPDIGVDYNSLINARFLTDSFQYTKRLDGLYECEADIIEVKV